MFVLGLGNFFGLIIGKDENYIHYFKKEGELLHVVKKATVSGRMIEKDKWTVFHIK
jgi:hypothetical protein